MRRYDNVRWSKEEGDRLKGMGLGTACLWTAHSGKIGSLTQHTSNSDKISKRWVHQFWQDLIHTSENKPSKEPKIHKGGSSEWNTVTKTQTNRSSFVNSACYLKRCVLVCVFEPSEIYIRAPLFCSSYGLFINHIVNIQSRNSPVFHGQGSFWNMDFTATHHSHNSVILSETWCVHLCVPCILNWLSPQLWCFVFVVVFN